MIAGNMHRRFWVNDSNDYRVFGACLMMSWELEV
jgi:hypothetical protein